MGIRTVFFDAAGTLFQVRGSVGQVYAQVAERHGWKPESEGQIDRLEMAFRAALRGMPPLAFHNSSDVREKEKQWWRRLVRESVSGLISVPDFDAFFEDLYQQFGRAEAWVLSPYCQRTLKALRRRGLRLGIISNFDSRLPGLLEALKLLPYFELVLYSSAARAAKPDSRLFRLALARLEVRAEECLHVGDDPLEDFEGARRVGLHSLLYDPKRLFEGFTSQRIESLAQVESFLV